MSKFTDETALYYFNRGVSTAAYRELGCHEATGEYGERVFADVTAEIALYKATNPVCPECGAEQRHWRTS